MFNEHFSSIPYSSDIMRESNKDNDDNKNKCLFCNKMSPIQYYVFSHRYLEQKYFEAFNFYFAKPINELVANLSLPHVINFKDKAIEDEDSEYLKRFYNKNEISSRINALTNFYKSSYKPLFPNLCIVEQQKMLMKRNQRHVKLFFTKNNQNSEIESKLLNPKEMPKADDIQRNFQRITNQINDDIDPGKGFKKHNKDKTLQESELENILGSFIEENAQSSNIDCNLTRQAHQDQGHENSLLKLFERKYSESSNSSSCLHDIYKPKLSDCFFFDSSDIFGFSKELKKDLVPDSSSSKKEAKPPFKTGFLSEVKKIAQEQSKTETMETSHKDYRRFLKEQVFESLDSGSISQRTGGQNYDVIKALKFKNETDGEIRRTPGKSEEKPLPITLGVNTARVEQMGKRKLQKEMQSKGKKTAAAVPENIKKIYSNIQKMDMMKHLDLLKNVMLKSMGKKKDTDDKGLTRPGFSITPQPSAHIEKNKISKEDNNTRLRSNHPQSNNSQKKSQIYCGKKDRLAEGIYFREKDIFSSPLRHSWEVNNKRLKQTNTNASKTDRPISGELGRPKIYYKKLNQYGKGDYESCSKIKLNSKENDSFHNINIDSEELVNEAENKMRNVFKKVQEANLSERRKHSKSQNKEKILDVSNKQKMAISQVAMLVSENPDLFKFATSGHLGSIHCTGTNNININNYVSTYKTGSKSLKNNSSPKGLKSAPLSSERQINQKTKIQNKPNVTPEKSPNKQDFQFPNKNIAEEVKRKTDKCELKTKVANPVQTNSGTEVMNPRTVTNTAKIPKEDLKKCLRLNLEKLNEKKPLTSVDTREEGEKPILHNTQLQENQTDENELSTYGFWTSRSTKQAWTLEDLTLMRAMIDKAIIENKRNQIKKNCSKYAANSLQEKMQLSNKKKQAPAASQSQTKFVKNKSPHASYSGKKELNNRNSSNLKANIESLLTFTNSKNRLNILGSIKTDRENSNSEFSERELLQKGHLTDRVLNNQNKRSNRGPDDHFYGSYNNDLSNSDFKKEDIYYEIVGNVKKGQNFRK